MGDCRISRRLLKILCYLSVSLLPTWVSLPTPAPRPLRRCHGKYQIATVRSLQLWSLFQDGLASPDPSHFRGNLPEPRRRPGVPTGLGSVLRSVWEHVVSLCLGLSLQASFTEVFLRFLQQRVLSFPSGSLHFFLKFISTSFTALVHTLSHFHLQFAPCYCLETQLIFVSQSLILKPCCTPVLFITTLCGFLRVLCRRDYGLCVQIHFYFVLSNSDGFCLIFLTNYPT